MVLRISVFNEILKFGKLIEHYHFHENKDSEITILEFITVHYLKDQQHDDDFAMDMQLPFKCCKDIDGQHHIKLITYASSVSEVEYRPQIKINAPLKVEKPEDLYVGDVWMPPKNV